MKIRKIIGRKMYEVEVPDPNPHNLPPEILKPGTNAEWLESIGNVFLRKYHFGAKVLRHGVRQIYNAPGSYFFEGRLSEDSASLVTGICLFFTPGIRYLGYKLYGQFTADPEGLMNFSQKVVGGVVKITTLEEVASRTVEDIVEDIAFNIRDLNPNVFA